MATANKLPEEEKISERLEKLKINTNSNADEDKKTCSVILHQIEENTVGRLEREFLQKLALQVEQDKFSLKVKKVTSDPGHQSYFLDRLEQVLKNLDESVCRVEKVILAFPDKEFIEAELNEIVNKIMEKGQHFVTIIMYNDIYASLPLELTEFKLRRIEVDRDLANVDVKAVAMDLRPFMKDEPKTVDLAFMNAGTGLAWSYYFGYLWFILPKFEKQIRESKWREANMDIPEENISKTMLIVFPTNCREPKAMNSDRVKFMINKMPLDRAGIRRNYDFDFREIVSKDGTESHYGVVYYLNVVQSLCEMRDDPTKEFVDLSEEIMRKEGKYCFERLKLFLKYAYNESIQIDSSKYKLIEYNSEEENANEKLADDLFDSIKDVNERKTEAAPAVKQPKFKIGVLYCERGRLPANIRAYLDNLGPEAREIPQTSAEAEVFEGFRIIENSERVLMILDDEFIASPHFDTWFYRILDYNLSSDKEFDRRSLVVLDCLKSGTADHPSALNLHLFSHVSHKDQEWERQVTKELNGEPQKITNDLMFLNIGTGLALSWYYRYLKIRVPKVVEVIRQCPALKKKFEDGLMSYKVFVLHPQSCSCPKKVTDADLSIKQVDDKEINLPHIMKATRDYTPKVYSIMDDGKEYYVIVEYNTQAETLHRMTREGFLTKSLMLSEWERFFNKLKTLITHPQEPMKLIERFKTIEYNEDDEKIMTPENGELAKLLLKHVKYEIGLESRRLPEDIDNGATIEMIDWEKR